VIEIPRSIHGLLLSSSLFFFGLHVASENGSSGLVYLNMINHLFNASINLINYGHFLEEKCTRYEHVSQKKSPHRPLYFIFV
jgi:hypothetical protein